MNRFVLLFIFISYLSLCLMGKTLEVTVSSYTSAQISSANAPAGLSIKYFQTNNRKSQLTSGNSLTLVISGHIRASISGVGIRVKSNQSAGAGYMTIKTDNIELWSIGDAKFSDKLWNGSFSNSYVTLNHSINGVLWGDSIVLSITATANSLYFECLTIEYEDLPDVPHTVHFISYAGESCSDLSESYTGEGIVLPTPGNIPDWEFVGWSTSPIRDTSFVMGLLTADSIYHPLNDVTLYAVFRNEGLYFIDQAKSFVTRQYAMVYHNQNGNFYILSGYPVDGKAPTEEFASILFDDSIYTMVIDYLPDDYRYDISFTDSTIVIQHVASTHCIGRVTNRNKLSDGYYFWRWEEAENGSILIYTPYSERILRLIVWADIDPESPKGSYVLELYPADKDLTKEYFLLFPIEEVPTEPIIIFTSNPLGIDIPSSISHAKSDFPDYERIDWNMPYSVYDIMGKGYPSPQILNKGVWLIRQNGQCFKIAR